MKKAYVLYNPKSGCNTGDEGAKKLYNEIKNKELVYYDITKIKSYDEFFASVNEGDEIIIAGGDGTLSRFANDTYHINFRNPILYYATGTGNDFLKDLNCQKGDKAFLVNDYIMNTPVMTFNNKEYCFVNGVGGGLDAYACVEGNKAHKKGKSGNYVLNAIKGILYDYKPMNAKITVDGKKYDFENVWFASVMKGRYFGGGIMLAPNQDRTSGRLSAVVVHKVGRLRLLPIIPGAFTGKHIKYKEYVTIIEGENITVEFDRFVPVQYDGETVENVTSYTVKAKSKDSLMKAL